MQQETEKSLTLLCCLAEDNSQQDSPLPTNLLSLLKVNPTEVLLSSVDVVHFFVLSWGFTWKIWLAYLEDRSLLRRWWWSMAHGEPRLCFPC